MQNTLPKDRRIRFLAIAATVGAIALSLSACSSSDSTTGSAVAQNVKATLVVWTDATREPGLKLYQKEHPGTKMQIQLYDPTTLLTKIQLANRTGSGWPDVIFDSLPNDAAALSSSLYNYTADLSNLVPKTIQKNFGTSNETCTIGGKLVCLKNDLAQSVLWYNAPLMAKFGYTVPTTWTQYETLGNEVAKDHPGYIIGVAGSSYIYNDFLWSSGCPIQTVVNSAQVKINLAASSCTRVSSVLDPLIANGSVSRFGPFDPEVAALGKAQKILMMPGASWYGDFVFQPAASYDTPDGVIAAAPYPTWAGASKNYSGSTGGGIWMVSRHSKNLKGAVAIAQFMTTSNQVQKTAPTFPAYGPAATAWSQRLATDKFYAKNPFPVLQAASQLINPAESPTRYSVDSVVGSTLAASVKSGGSIAAEFPDLQTQLTGLAQSVGYAVTK